MLGYIWAVWVIVQSFLIIGAAPWFAIAMIALATFVIYGALGLIGMGGGELT